MDSIPPPAGASTADFAAWERYAAELDSAERGDEAIAAYGEAQRLRLAQGLPPNPHYAQLVGNIHTRLGADQLALDSYRWAQQQYAAQGLALDPGLALNIGNSYQRLGDYPAAEAAYTQCEALLQAQGEAPGHSLFKNRGALQLMLQRPVEALALLDEAVRLREAAGLGLDVELIVSRAAALRDSGRLDEAHTELDEAEALTGPASWPVAYHRARIFEQQGKFFAAGQEARRAQNLFAAHAPSALAPPPDLAELVTKHYRGLSF